MTCHSYSSKTSFTFLMLILLMCIGPKNVSAQAGRLPFSEVEALQEIAAQLGMKDWNFRVNPCNHPSWKTPPSVERSLHNNTVNCNCSYPNGVCHVVMIFLKGQDLGGTLPAAVVKLPYLKQIDLNRNYLSGSIPREWASTKLEFLSISANNLSGRIDYLGKITTLQFLSIESNLFSGPIPPELGNLVDLETLILNANNLTGELPTALTYLTRLKILRISSNSFTGRMPDFFRSWKQLQALEIQASGLKGPIPSSISVLSNLTELDLSFNRLEGEIPNFGGLISLDTIYLTGNLLNGPIPEWIKGRDTG